MGSTAREGEVAGRGGYPGGGLRPRRGSAGGEARALSDDVLAAVHVGLIVWELEDPADPTGMRLVYSNPAAEAATGLPVEGILGRTMREVLPGTVETQFPAALAEVERLVAGGTARGDAARGVTQSR